MSEVGVSWGSEPWTLKVWCHLQVASIRMDSHLMSTENWRTGWNRKEKLHTFGDQNTSVSGVVQILPPDLIGPRSIINQIKKHPRLFIQRFEASIPPSTYLNSWAADLYRNKNAWADGDIIPWGNNICDSASTEGPRAEQSLSLVPDATPVWVRHTASPCHLPLSVWGKATSTLPPFKSL